MHWMNRILNGNRDSPPFMPLPANPTNRSLRERVCSLSTDELEVYKWLREGYSLEWTAETVLRSIAECKRIARAVCRKLGVRNQREVVRAYGLLDKYCREPIVPRDIFKE